MRNPPALRRSRRRGYLTCHGGKRRGRRDRGNPSGAPPGARPSSPPPLTGRVTLSPALGVLEVCVKSFYRPKVVREARAASPLLPAHPSTNENAFELLPPQVIHRGTSRSRESWPPQYHPKRLRGLARAGRRPKLQMLQMGAGMTLALTEFRGPQVPASQAPRAC